jgi:V/A-type H+-transporting ATPase subunit D
MTEKIKFTRPELKRYRDRLARFEHYLPMLKLKQQQLQRALEDAARRRRSAEQALANAIETLRAYGALLSAWSGVPLKRLSRPERVRTSRKNIAGVAVPVFEQVDFSTPAYSLFGTPAWVDGAVADMREKSRRQAALDVLREEHALVAGQLARVIQRVNLFEGIMIPHHREAIRRIRIQLGDEMAAAVGRAKIAKNRLARCVPAQPGRAET